MGNCLSRAKAELDPAYNKPYVPSIPPSFPPTPSPSTLPPCPTTPPSIRRDDKSFLTPTTTTSTSTGTPTKRTQILKAAADHFDTMLTEFKNKVKGKKYKAALKGTAK
jgi:hypothetical protein